MRSVLRPVRAGMALGVATPLTKTLRAQVRLKEAESRSRGRQSVWLR